MDEGSLKRKREEDVNGYMNYQSAFKKQRCIEVFCEMDADEEFDALLDKVNEDDEYPRNFAWLIRESNTIEGVFAVCCIFPEEAGKIKHFRYAFTNKGWEQLPSDKKAVTDIQPRIIKLDKKGVNACLSDFSVLLESRDSRFNPDNCANPIAEIKHEANFLRGFYGEFQRYTEDSQAELSEEESDEDSQHKENFMKIS